MAESVFVNDNLIFRPSVTVNGYGDKPGPLTLAPARRAGRRTCHPGRHSRGGRQAGQDALEYRPTKPGVKVFVIDTYIRPDEVDKDNNSVESPPVFVSEVKLIKVLYVEGYGRWEFRYVKSLLERESERSKNKKLIDLSVYLARPSRVLGGGRGPQAQGPTADQGRVEPFRRGDPRRSRSESASGQWPDDAVSHGLAHSCACAAAAC